MSTGRKGVSVASATLIDFDSLTGDYFLITGTTTIAGFAYALAGTEITTVFQSVLILTHSSSFDLLGSENWISEANDKAVWRSEGSSGWTMINYIRESGLNNNNDNNAVAYAIALGGI